MIQLIDMNTKLDIIDTGWVGLSLALEAEEIELLLRRLNELKSGNIKHFHFRNADFESQNGVADIEITTIGKDETSNMTID